MNATNATNATNDDNTLKGLFQIAFVAGYFIFLKIFYPPLFYLTSIFMVGSIFISFCRSFFEKSVRT